MYKLGKSKSPKPLLFNVAIPKIQLFMEDIPEMSHDDCPNELLCTEEEVYA